MRIATLAVFGLVIRGMAAAQGLLSPADFLRELMQDDKRMPQMEEGVRIMDQIAVMTPGEVRALLPVVFETFNATREIVKLEGALALHAVAMRQDGPVLLGPRQQEVLGLLRQKELRIKLAGIVIAEKMQVPSAIAVPVLLQLLNDPAQPDQIKPAAIASVARIGPLTPQTAQVVASFLGRATDAGVKIDALNGLASTPRDDNRQIQLVLLGLSDNDAAVRAATISLLRRLGPKALDMARPALAQLADSPSESETIRKAAGEVIRPQTR
ncbi:MAG: hypothetical protein H7039_14750 [Bryobacteraceae bacterium]|nr:hypothetical protein [Bryobacteraceae bacterium]